RRARPSIPTLPTPTTYRTAIRSSRPGTPVTEGRRGDEPDHLREAHADRGRGLLDRPRPAARPARPGRGRPGRAHSPLARARPPERRAAAEAGAPAGGGDGARVRRRRSGARDVRDD